MYGHLLLAICFSIRPNDLFRYGLSLKQTSVFLCLTYLFWRFIRYYKKGSFN